MLVQVPFYCEASRFLELARIPKRQQGIVKLVSPLALVHLTFFSRNHWSIFAVFANSFSVNWVRLAPMALAFLDNSRNR